MQPHSSSDLTGRNTGSYNGQNKGSECTGPNLVFLDLEFRNIGTSPQPHAFDILVQLR